MRAYGYGSNWYTDGCGCYHDDGKCFCADCFYYGADHVNCQLADSLKNKNDLRPFDWDPESQKWVEVTPDSF